MGIAGRIPVLRTGNLQQLTSDHSLVAEQVRRGIITPQQAEESDMQSVLLRWLWERMKTWKWMSMKLAFIREMFLLLCSDGLTRMVTEPEIAACALQAETNPSTAGSKACRSGQ